MRVAFKEWAVVVDALGRGEQTLILRKGGIHEGSDGFQVEEEEFFLFPTLYHQQRAGVIPSAQERYDQMAGALTVDQVPIQYACRVVESRLLASWPQAASLVGQHIWTEDVLRERFHWGRDTGIFALAVRVS